jgi:hypothetical protein
MTEARELSANERATLRQILRGASFAGASALSEQIDRAKVVGGIPTLLDLEVDGSAAASAAPDGPIPVEALVEGTDGAIEGMVMVWVTGGYLSALEYAWVTDEVPRGMPPAESIRAESA